MKIVNPIAVFGEEKACEYLKKIGYKIIDRNYRKKYKELDIIAIDPSTSSGQVPSDPSGQAVLVFVEVKTRFSVTYGTPFEGISYWKLKSIVNLAQYYKLTHKNLPDGLRIDAIGVTLINEKKVGKIEHIKNISGF